MTTPILGLPELAANQAQPHLTVNAATRILEALLQTAVTSVLNTPPGSPADGDRYIVGLSPTGDWVGHEDDIALYRGTAWTYLTPAEGWLVWLRSVGKYYAFGADGSSPPAWAELAVGSSVATDPIFDAAGDLVVGSGANASVVLAAGAEGTYLQIIGGLPSWDAPPTPNLPFYFTHLFHGAPTATQRIAGWIIPAGLSFSCGDILAQAFVAPSDNADTLLDVQMNGSSVGTIHVDSSGFGYGVDDVTGPHVPTGGVVEIFAPATPDSTMADVAITVRFDD